MYLSLLRYKIPLLFEDPPKDGAQKFFSFTLEYNKGIFNLSYCTHTNLAQCFPKVLPAEDGIPLISSIEVCITPGEQVIVPTNISVVLPKNLMLIFFGYRTILTQALFDVLICGL